MKIPIRLIDFLNQQEVRYEVVHHPVAYTAQELAAIEGVPGREHAKVVVVKMPEGLALAVLPADRRINLARLGATALATEVEFRTAFPDCELGTMPPFGHLYGVPTFVDLSLMESTRIVFEAGTYCDAIKMNVSDYEKIARAVRANFSIKWNA